MKTKIGTWRSTGVSVVLHLCVFGRFLVWRHGAGSLAGGRADKVRWRWYQVKRVKSTVGGVVQAGTVVMRERWEVGGGGGAAARST